MNYSKPRGFAPAPRLHIDNHPAENWPVNSIYKVDFRRHITGIAARPQSLLKLLSRGLRFQRRNHVFRGHAMLHLVIEPASGAVSDRARLR
jgi:hypothetical protein